MMYNMLISLNMIKENILKIRERIALTCSRVNRDPGLITIVAVSKGRTPEQIKQVIDSGITDIGENKVQEALVKYNEITNKRVSGSRINWHMVGHLQTNKAKDAVRIFGLIHSVDSLHLAGEIDRQAGKINKIQDILIEVKTSAEPTKFGLKPDEIFEVIKGIAELKNINLKGLMTIAPLLANPDESRPYFSKLRKLRDKINPTMVLSMGMTDDFELAIEEGATMVRIGRAIFEG